MKTGERGEREIRTFTVNPKQRAHRPFPFTERVPMDKPLRTPLMVGLARNIVVPRRIRRR